MSNKYALIFALAALCCLVATTEAAAQRRNGLVRTPIEQADEIQPVDADNEEVEEGQIDEEGDQEGREEAGQVAVQSNEHRNTAIDNGSKKTVARPSNEDGRARRVVRRRRGNRRNRSNRRRRGGRKNRSGVRRTIRRRSGKPLRG
ncbi:protein nemuri [Drosophila hydei]|uniref:Protein nemuri n=1 Tax=Drosophila hydei TaxID=7224 RepID=A0A6J1M072_DROHY|nr:protein nemuri [Drosophila hydei]